MKNDFYTSRRWDKWFDKPSYKDNMTTQPVDQDNRFHKPSTENWENNTNLPSDLPNKDKVSMTSNLWCRCLNLGKGRHHKEAPWYIGQDHPSFCSAHISNNKLFDTEDKTQRKTDFQEKSLVIRICRSKKSRQRFLNKYGYQLN